MLQKTKIPATAKRVPLRPLALGEVTGHHHSLFGEGVTAVADSVQMYELETEEGLRVFLRVTDEGISLQHQEHKTHAPAPGEYEVIIQQQETDWGAQPVQD